MIGFILNLVIAVVGIALGAYILFLGRRTLGATLGIIALAASADVLAILFTTAESGRELIDVGAWGWTAVAVGIAILGALVGRSYPYLAVQIIGIIAGVSIALWLLDIAAFVLTSVAHMSEQWTIIVAIALVAIGGLAGNWLVRTNRDDALIILAALIGAELIGDSLRLNPASNLTAIIFISLVLAGVLTRYANHLREERKDIASALGEPAPSSVAILQELDIG